VGLLCAWAQSPGDRAGTALLRVLWEPALRAIAQGPRSYGCCGSPLCGRSRRDCAPTGLVGARSAGDRAETALLRVLWEPALRAIAQGLRSYGSCGSPLCGRSRGDRAPTGVVGARSAGDRAGTALLRVLWEPALRAIAQGPRSYGCCGSPLCGRSRRDCAPTGVVGARSAGDRAETALLRVL
jgi:hypothetical protein